MRASGVGARIVEAAKTGARSGILHEAKSGQFSDAEQAKTVVWDNKESEIR